MTIVTVTLLAASFNTVWKKVACVVLISNICNVIYTKTEVKLSACDGSWIGRKFNNAASVNLSLHVAIV